MNTLTNEWQVGYGVNPVRTQKSAPHATQLRRPMVTTTTFGLRARERANQEVPG